MISLLKVEYENFQNVRRAEIPLAGQGVVLVVGENGSGKSTMFGDGIYYGLYGRSLRWGENPGDLVVGRDGKSMMVRIELDANGERFTVIRARSHKDWPNGLTLLDKAGETVSLRKTKDTQQVLNSILGQDHTAFRVSALFSDAAHFQSLDVAKQRKILDDLLELGVLDAAHTRSKKELTELTAQKESIERDLARERGVIDTTKAELDEAVKMSKEWESNFAAEMAEWEKNDRDIRRKISSIEEWIAEAKEQRSVVNKRVSETEDEIGKLERQAKRLDDDIQSHQRRYNSLYTEVAQLAASLESEVNASCPACKQALPADEVKKARQHLESEAEKKMEELEKLSQLIKDLKRDRRSIVMPKVDPGDAEFLEKVDSALDDSRDQLSQLRSEAKPKPSSTNPYAATVVRLRSRLEEKQAEMKAGQAELHSITQRLGEEEVLCSLFGPNGCRHVVTQRAIPFLNAEAARVREVMGTTMALKFEYRNGGLETLLNHPTGASEYRGGSKGEKQQADLITLFCLMGLVRRKGSAAFRQVFIDEAFDGLDEAKCAGAARAIRSIEGADVFVLSHHPNMMEADQVWTVSCGEIDMGKAT